jgi:acyl-CoA oxidase
MSQSEDILNQDIWHSRNDIVPPASNHDIAIHYKRAQSICVQSGLSQDDIMNLTPKYWDFHFDLIAARDMTAYIIAMIHINLCIGTLCSFIPHRPDLQPLLDRLLRFEVCGGFMLTEVAHGLDARNLETTATLLPDGSYDLHTPHAGAAKAMPPNTPYCEMPRVAVVYARLMVDEEDHGVKPFLVLLSDAMGMRPGVTSLMLPTRPGTKPLDHSLTSFNHVSLPSTALLGSSSKPENGRIEFLRHIRRVPVGTVSFSILGISAIKVGTRIAAVYSERRTVASVDGGKERKRIMDFSTQQVPIVEGWVHEKVLNAFARWTIDMCPDLTDPTQHALATIFKATVVKASQVLRPLAERCGWQGFFAFNQISELDLTFQGNTVSEGDTLVLCIRFMPEVLAGSLVLPQAMNRSSRLAQREEDLIRDMKSRLERVGGYENHRGPAFDRYILPRCRLLAEAIGNRMAYEAAEKSGISSEVLTLYERICLCEDLDPLPALEPLVQARAPSRSCSSYSAVLAQIRSESVTPSEVDDYITAPITSDKSWESFMKGLQMLKSPLDVLTSLSKL